MSVLDGADMRAGVFTGADMSSADLSNSDLRGTDLSATVLIGAILLGINTNGGTSFAGASYDLTTQFDAGFDPLAEGMVLVREAGTGTLIALALLAALATRTRPGSARAPGGDSGEDREGTSLQQR